MRPRLLPSSTIETTLRSLTSTSRLRFASCALTSSSASTSSLAATSPDCGSGTKTSRRPPRLAKRNPLTKPISASVTAESRRSLRTGATTIGVAAADCKSGGRGGIGGRVCAHPCSDTDVSRTLRTTNARLERITSPTLTLSPESPPARGVERLQLPRRRLAQPMQRLAEGVDFLRGQSALGMVRLEQNVLGAARRAPGLRKPDGRPDADQAMHPAVHFGDLFGRRGGGSRQAGNCRIGVLDLALERRDETVPHLGEALGKRVDGHD